MKGGSALPFMLVLGLGTVLCALALAPLILNRPISIGSTPLAS